MPASPEFFAASLLLGLPLAVFLVLWLAGKSVNKMAGWIGALATGAGLAASFLLVDIHAVHSLSFEWLEIGQRPIFLSFRIDNLAFVMLLVVHLVALLVQVYSTAYLRGDENLHRYFAFVQLFLFSMIGIVLSGSLLVMYIFWELVGLSSYLLIGFWYTKKRPVWAAQKAFVLNRIGDAAFLTGILLLFYYIGSTDFEVLVSNVHTISPGMLTLIGICLFGGCVGKSAQFPLSGWLPDAMEGPTPVSALIHAATMVAAGIFLLTRIFFLLTPDAQLFIAVIGTITMLTGAVKATFAWDIKRVLAFSTMSQLGLMVTAVGVGSWQMAFFHLVTHAFFKAGLFLSAGSVIHALHYDGTSDFDPQDMRTMGGLRTSLPVTFICFLICAAALSGLPLFSGFLSKDAIITEGFLSAASIGPVAYVFPVLMMLAAGLTAYYMTRQVWLVFFGTKRFSGEEIHPHESPSVMWVPMAILSLLSFFIWFSLNPVSAEDSWFLHLTGGSEAGHLSWVPIAASAISLIAIFVAYRETRTNNPFGMDSLLMRDKQRPAFSWFRDFSNEHYFLVPFSSLAGLAGKFEIKVVDAFVNFIARANVVTAHLVSWIDCNVVDGAVRLTVYMIRFAGNSVRGLQNGKIQSYFLVTLTGIFLLILWLATL